MLFKLSFIARKLFTNLSVLATLAYSFPVDAAHLLPTLAGANVAVTDAASLFNPSSYGQWYLNTDNGHIYGQYSNYPWDDKGASGQIVSQTGGPDVWVWNFSNLNITASLRIFGSRPAVIRSVGDIGINAAVVVEAGGQTGGIGGKNTDSNNIQNASDNGSAGAGTNGGLGGQGGGHIVNPGSPSGMWTYVFSGGGGGGGGFRAGQDAPTDAPVMPYVYNGSSYVPAPPALQYAGGHGGAANISFSVLRGGGGGGGGGDGSGWGGGGDPFSPGGNGGAGGGAILFATPGNLSIGINGSISVNGKNPAYIGAANTEASGGGGAGGYAAFSIGGIFTNDGSITARGAYGSYSNGLLHLFPPVTSSMGGSGSGGYVAIDAKKRLGNGTINVAGGDGSNAISGHIFIVRPMNVESFLLLD